MTPFARSTSTPSARRLAVAPRRRTQRLALASATIVCFVLLVVSPASAFISGGFGLQRREPVLVQAHPLQYHSGPILHSSDVYVVYWDPNRAYRGDWERLIDRFFKDVGAESGQPGDVFGLDSQYTGGGGRAANQTTFRGSYKDEDPYPESGNCSEAAVTVCLTDSQIQSELTHVITSVAPPLPGSSGTPIYYMLTPPGVTVCTGGGSPASCSNSTALEEEAEEIKEGKVKHPAETGICGYHAALETGGSKVPYVVQPWVAGDAGAIIESYNPLITSSATPDVLACQDNVSLKEPNQEQGLNAFGNYAAGLADVIVGDLSIEQRNVVVDPFLNGWYQSATNAEQGDMCQFAFGPPPATPPTPNEQTHAVAESNEEVGGDGFYLPWAYASTTATARKVIECWSGAGNEPYFTAPNPVSAGDIVGFNATESNLTLNAKTSGLSAEEPYTAPVYSWDFGDGTTVTGVNAASEFHSYAHGGEYNVALTVTDSGGYTRTTNRRIVVAGESRSSAAGAGAGGSTTPGAAGAGAGHGSVPAPVATAAIVSKALKTTLRRGLAVRYSVNEQVAGRFEVLLSRATARRLKIAGPLATGLPVGSSPQLVIAKAILVTTKGGRSTVHIQFSKKTAGRLAHVHKVSLMLRLTVRNAASSSPLTTTVLSTGTLVR